MTPEVNKQLAIRWYKALMSGDVRSAEAILDQNCRFFIAGDMGFCGWMDRATFMTMNVVPLTGPITMDFGEIVAERDIVVLEAESHAPLERGETYNNNYAFVLRFRDGRMIEHKEYTDTLHFHRVIDTPIVREPPITRQSPLTSLSFSVCGNPGRTALEPTVAAVAQ